jgi:hypothetical protein
MFNLGYTINEQVEKFPAYGSRIWHGSVPASGENYLSLNNHSLGCRPVNVVTGLLRAGLNEGVSVFLHNPMGFEGLVPKAEELPIVVRFNTLYVSQFDLDVQLFASSQVEPVGVLTGEQSEMVAWVLTQTIATKLQV